MQDPAYVARLLASLPGVDAGASAAVQVAVAALGGHGVRPSLLAAGLD